MSHSHHHQFLPNITPGGGIDPQSTTPRFRHGHSSTTRHHSSVSPRLSKFRIPKPYQRIEWKKSGFESGDVESGFNMTRLPGLEALTVNSYCNSLIFVLYYIDYLRGFLLSHLCKRGIFFKLHFDK